MIAWERERELPYKHRRVYLRFFLHITQQSGTGDEARRGRSLAGTKSCVQGLARTELVMSFANCKVGKLFCHRHCLAEEDLRCVPGLFSLEFRNL